MSRRYCIGVDPSLSSTGIAHDNGLLTTTVTHTKDGNARLQAIHRTVLEAAGNGHWAGYPALAVIEDLPKRAMSAGLTGQAQGVIRMALCDAGVSILELDPASLKKYATGKGNADKKEVIAAWNERAHAKVKDDNQADAAWLRQYGRMLFRIAEGEVVHLPDTRKPKSFENDVELVRNVLAGYTFQ